MASICCSPPLRVMESWLLPLLENRKKLINFFQGLVFSFSRLGRIGPDLQVFQHGQTGKDPAALGNHGDPLNNRLIGRDAVDLISPELNRSVGRFFHPRNGIEQGRFAGSIGADD